MNNSDIFPTKRNLVVTLADRNYLDAAKQLFSSLYFNSGWDGDYMLITNDLSESEKKEFSDRGIIVYCPPLLGNDFFDKTRKYPPLLISKFYLFQTSFKRWEKIIFLDPDIIVFGSIDKLALLSGFNAPKAEDFVLKNEFIEDESKIRELNLDKDYNLNTEAFCSGVISFDSNIINKNSFSDLLSLYKKYKSICRYGDEPIFNLYFYKNWQKLSIIYNFNPEFLKNKSNINNKRISPPFYHFFSFLKPWDKSNNYYKTWKDNLIKFSEINLKQRLKAKDYITDEKETEYLKYIKKSIIIYKLLSPIAIINKYIGLIGKMIEKKYPKVYKKIRNERIKTLK